MKATQTMHETRSTDIACVRAHHISEFSNLTVLLESFAFRVLLRVHNEEKTKMPSMQGSKPWNRFFRLRKAAAADD